MTEPHIAIIGNVNVDMIMGPQAPWPEPGTEVALPDYELRVGGQAGNAALALAALGAPFRLYGNAGDDVLGRWLRDSFGEAARHWRLSERPTTVSVGIAHPNGERTFFTNAGHLEALDLDDVLPHLPSRAAEGSIALLVGTFLTPLLAESFPDLLRALKAANYRIALDTGWPPEGWSGQARRHLSGWLPPTDFLLVNEVEACSLADAGDVESAARRIRPLLPAEATLVVKRGADGASAWRGNDAVTSRSPAVRVAESLGAGDIFNAGFLAAELDGRPLLQAVRAGVAFASATIATRPRRFPNSSGL